ncbi:MAG: hypothetical protein ACE5HX_01500 [bacterium]
MARITFYFLALFWLIASLTCLSCSSSSEPKISQPDDKIVRSSVENKISFPIRNLLDKIAAKAMSAQSVEDTKLSSLSNSLVKLDDKGNIQCYIYLSEATEENIAQLRTKLAKVDLFNKQLKIVQAWVLYNKIKEIAKFAFVKQVTPPDYGRKLSQ